MIIVTLCYTNLAIEAMAIEIVDLPIKIPTYTYLYLLIPTYIYISIYLSIYIIYICPY